MTELSGGSSPSSPADPMVRENAARYATPESTRLIVKWATRAPWMDPRTIAALVMFRRLDPDSEMGQAIMEAESRRKAKPSHKGVGWHTIGEIAHAPATIANAVVPENVENWVGNVTRPVGGVARHLQPMARGGLTALDSLYQTGQGLVRNVATGVNEAAAGALAGAAAGAGIGAGVGLLGGPFAEITSPVGAVVGALAGGVIGGVSTAIANPDVEGEANWNVASWSTGGLALEKALRGEHVDLGSGIVPGGDIVKEQAAKARAQASIDGHAVTPGRLLAADVVEPGSRAYNVASGLLDASVALGPADPAAATLKGIGGVNAARRTVLAGEADAWLMSKAGQKVTNKLVEMDDFNEIWHLTKKKLPVDVALEISKTSDPNRVADILRGELGSTLREAPTVARLPVVNRSIRRVRMLQEMPGSHIDTLNKDAALDEFDKAQRNAKLPEHVIAENNRALAEARSPGEMYQVVVDKFLNHDLTQKIAEHTPDTRRGRQLARELTTAWRNHHPELSKYFVDEIGDNAATPGAVIDGAGKAVPTPHLLVEYLNGSIPLPDARGVRQATTQLGRIASNPTVKVPVTFLDAYQNNLWKPMALLRGAWTVRVVGEEQIRMAASGMSSLFHHPISHIALIVGKQGRVGIAGDDLLESAEGVAAMAKGSAGWRQAGKIRTGAKVLFDREMDPEYARAWGDELAQLSTDPVSKRLAGAVDWNAGDAIAPGYKAIGNPLNDVKEWFWGGVGRKLRSDLANLGAPVLTRPESDAYIDSVFRRLQIKTAGDPELIDMVATGAHAGRKLIPTPGDLDSKVVDALDAKRAAGIGPQKVKGDYIISRKASAASEATAKLDRAVEAAFGMLMTKPTNTLSRSPAFRQFYWQRIEELLPAMDIDAQTRALEQAARSKAPDLAALRRAAGKGTGSLHLGDADGLAKAFGLDQTRKLLYDLSRKNQFFDIHRLLFPFGEAWKEILTTWARIGTRSPYVIRRGQQIITGLRNADPMDTGHGFFYTDANGQEVFAYPGSAWLTDKVIGAPVPMTGRVQGLSIATNVIPAVGPVVQIPAGALLPKTPDWDWARNLLIPFGERDTEEGFIESNLPPWLQKLKTTGWFKDVPGIGAPSAQQQRAVNGAAFDLLSWQVTTGQRPRPSTPDEIQRGIEENMNKARLLYLVRGAAQFAAPTAPTPEMRAADKQGNVEVLNVLRTKYRELAQDEKAGGWATANQRFLDTYGEDALFAIQSRSTATIYALPVTTEGDNWVRDHPDIKRRYKNTYGLWAPTGGEFDLTAYSRQFSSGEREGLTPDQMVLQANARIAGVVYDRAVQAAGEKPNAQQRVILRMVRDKLRDEFPGFGSDIAGVGKKTDLDTAITELRRGLKNPELASTDAGAGLKMYLQVRDAANVRAQQLGLASFRSASTAEPIRLVLRRAADIILKDHPGFGLMWEEVFSREMTDDDTGKVAA